MTKQPPRRNVELEAWDRELRGPAEDGDETDPGEARPEAPTEEAPTLPPGAGPGGATTAGSAGRTAGPATAPEGVAAADSRQTTDEEVVDGGPPASWNSPDEGVTTEILLRDLIIFQVKLLLDGLKDIVLSPLAIAAVLWDLVPSRNAPRGRAFYQILKVGERFDLWLNLYNPTSTQRADHEGLLEAGVHSADSLMGKLEQLARTEAAKQGQRPSTSMGGRERKRQDDLEM